MFLAASGGGAGPGRIGRSGSRDGQPMAYVTGGSTYFVHNDHLGTPQKFMDYNGDWSAGIRLRPSGEVESASRQSIYLRFPGQYDDTDTEDLYYNYFRDYGPSTGRYIQSDPIGLRGGVEYVCIHWR